MHAQTLEVRCPAVAARDRLAGVPVAEAWNLPDAPEHRIHRIHAYPAKFPALVATRAFAYGRDHGLSLRRVGDVFCGCGTVAFEARRAGLEFWGCDINPVATLIARVKTADVDPGRFRRYQRAIEGALAGACDTVPLSVPATARLRRWYTPSQFQDLARLRNAIDAVTPERSRYRDAFRCAFSAILKSASQWRQRSVKPALDLRKRPAPVQAAFARQCDQMAAAWGENHINGSPRPAIQTANAITVAPPREPLQMLVTSGPYVTAYDYASLHQLSSLWLGMAEDYRDLRHGAIGTADGPFDFRRHFSGLNDVGLQVVMALRQHDPSAASMVARYYLDMQQVARRCRELLDHRGIAVFVVGNTQYHGVPIDNASHLAEALLQAGFKLVRAAKRQISNKAHTPFRTREGRFSSNPASRQVFSEEFILMAHR